ncbi:MAG: hypothetical protein WDN26_23180 [Chitinophagaceae bacterium]
MDLLLITFYFPPTNAIAALRPYSWVNEFKRSGINLTVVTINFSGKEVSYHDFFKPVLTPVQFDESNGYRIYRLPFYNSFYHSLQRWGLFRYRVIRYFTYITCTAFGILNITQRNNRILKKFLQKHLRENKYDLIYGVTQPVNLIPLIASCGKKFNIPFAFDFKDFVVQAESKKINKSAREKFEIWLHKLYLSRHVKKAKFLTAVCQPILDELPFHPSKKVIFNGFEESLFDNIRPIETKDFVVTILGTLFPGKHIDVMVAGFKKFINNNRNEKIRINFLGTAAMEAVCSEIRNNIPAEYVNITERLPRQEALSIVKGSQVLYYHGWINYKGVYSGKIFEYLGAKKNILIAPNDHDVLETLINETKAGKLAEDADEMAQILSNWLGEWKKNDFLKYEGDSSIIEKYTREQQAKQLTAYITKQYTVFSKTEKKPSPIFKL